MVSPSSSELAAFSGLLQPLVASMPRIGTALMVLPFLPPSVVSGPLRAAVAISLALAMWPVYADQAAAMNWGAGALVGYALKEALIGALIGYTMGTLMWALGCVGELIDVQTGFNNAQIFDPFAGHQSGPIALLFTQLGALLFVSLGGLYVFLQILYESIALWPPNKFYPQLTAAWLDFTIDRSGSVLDWAARWATPVIAALLITELGINLISRVAPQINAFYFSLPIKASVALLVLSLLIAHLVDVVRHHVEPASQLLKTIDNTWRPR